MTDDAPASGGEFERETVPTAALLGSGKFWGMYAGEHAAGTEFMIGPLFLAAGASLQDLVLGLLLGNLLAVLTWRYLVTPIAIAKRLTLYYQLERIAGGSLITGACFRVVRENVDFIDLGRYPCLCRCLLFHRNIHIDFVVPMRTVYLN